MARKASKPASVGTFLLVDEVHGNAQVGAMSAVDLVSFGMQGQKERQVAGLEFFRRAHNKPIKRAAKQA